MDIRSQVDDWSRGQRRKLAAVPLLVLVLMCLVSFPLVQGGVVRTYGTLVLLAYWPTFLSGMAVSWARRGHVGFAVYAVLAVAIWFTAQRHGGVLILPGV